MADHLQMSRQAYYGILTNKSTRWSTLEKIAKALNLKPKDLII